MLQKTGKNSTCSLLIVKKNAKNADHVHFKNINLRSDTKLQMTFRLTFILFLLCTSSILSLGQYTYPPYRIYTLRDGLPQMQIWSMLQDSRGYLWIGTKGGISRYDGEKFVNYSQVDGLTDNRVDRIYEDFSGNIWIVTRFGISYFDGQKISTFQFLHSGLFLAPAPDGKIWYSGTLEATPAKSIFGYIEKDRFYNLIEKYPELSDEASGQVVYYKEAKSLIICTTHNVYELKGTSLKKILTNVVNPEIRISNSTISIFNWESPERLNMYKYRENKLELEAQVVNGNYVGKKRSEEMHTVKSGPGNSRILWIKSDTIETIDLPDKWINLSFIDRDQRMWIGTEEGLYKFYPRGFETFKRDALPMVWSIVEDKHQNMWFASLDLGLRKLTGNTLIHYPAESLKKYGSFFYYQSQVDERGTIYFPNYHGVMYYDGKSFGKISDGFCPASYYDKERKQLLVGSRRHIEFYDLQQRKVGEVGPNEGIQIKGWFAAFDKDNMGNIWGGGGTGLVRYNQRTGKINNFTRENGRLPCDGISCIHQPPVGDIWFGGTQGLLRYDEKMDSIIQLENPEIQDAVNLVSSIDSTWLLFSQPTGIYLLDLKKFREENKVELHLYNEQNGFIGLDPGQNGAAKDSKGNIWMTTGTEVVKMNPKELDFKKNRINVRISGFNGKPLLHSQKEISLPRNDRSAVVQFETICFNRPKAAQFSWKIGDDSEWSAWQNENYTVLTNLRDGESTLHVRTMIPGLPNSEAASSILMTVNIAVWKQEWFFPTMLALVSVLVLLSMVLFFQTRTRLIQTNKQAKMFQLQAILSQLNPHFIFNVMASLQSMILSANIEKANDYLVRMSALIRGFLDASASSGFSRSKNITATELPLKKELEILDHFIQFQQLIYPEKFDYELSLGPEIQPEKLTVPPMLIQPFVENSIKHGLLQKSGQGKLKISIFYSGKQTLTIEIEDDGIGTQKAEALMEKSHLLYTSRGKELTLKRIKLLNDMGYFIQFRTDSSERGTKVTLKIQRNAE